MKAIIYVRQSKDRDGDGAAVDRQLASCRLLAQARDLEVVEEIVENDTSATKGARPGFDRLMGRVSRGEVSAIIVWHSDRLYRKMSDLVKLMEIAEERDVSIMTVRGGDLDLTTASGRMFANMTASVARYEVEHKGERQMDANRQRADKGVWQFSRRPYGYERVNGEVRIVEDEADVLREAYRRYLDGQSYYAIVEDLNARSITTNDKNPWTVSTLRARLRNPAYAGILVFKGREHGEGNWPAIISRRTWSEFKRMQSHRKVRHDWSNQGRHLLSGLAECGVCGGRLFARPAYRRVGGERVTSYAYACRDNWCVQRNLERVDDLVSRVLVARFSQPDIVELVRVDESTADLDREAAELRARWDSLAMLAADGTLRPDAVREQSSVLRAKLEAIEAHIEAIRDRSVMTDMALATATGERWDSLSLPKRRNLIQIMMRVIVDKQDNPRRFDPEAVRIEWKHSSQT